MYCLKLFCYICIVNMNKKKNIMKDLKEFVVVMIVCCSIWCYFSYVGDFVTGGIISVLAMMIICLYNNVYEVGKRIKELENKIKNHCEDSDIKTV